MTYYESAEDIKISRERAIIELKRHGLNSREDIEEFDKYFGPVANYDAQAVLNWLGY